MEMGTSNAITFIVRTVAQNLNFEIELDPVGDVFINILSLQDVLPRIYISSLISLPPSHARTPYMLAAISVPSSRSWPLTEWTDDLGFR